MHRSIALVNSPYYLRAHSTFRYVEGHTLPMGLLSLAAVIRRDLPEVSVNLVDGMAEALTPGELLERILQTNPSLVGIGSFTYSINDTLLLAKWLKQRRPDVTVVLGGVHVTNCPQEVMVDSNVDFVFRGEAEYAFRDFVSGRPFESIPGLVWRDGSGAVVMHAETAVLDSVDDLPRPAYDLVDMKRYFPTAGQCRRSPAGAMITSRGCPGNCIFCSSAVSGHRARFRSAQSVFEEMEFLANTYGLREIIFMDDVFTLKNDRVRELCALILDNGLDVLWDCSTRAQYVDQDLLATMKRAGCNQISFGVETGDERVLSDIRKGQSLDQVREKVALAKAAGLESRCSFILGLPTDTVESMQHTIDFALELDPHLVSFYIASPYPGTDMYDWAVSNDMLVTTNWSYYDQSHHLMNIPGATAAQIDEMYQSAYGSFYHRPKYLFRRLMMLRSWYDVRNAALAARMTFNAHAELEMDFDAVQARVEAQYAG